MPSVNLPKNCRYTHRDFDREFPDEQACLLRVVELLYPYGIHCLKCGEVLKHHQLKTRPKVWSCDRCGTQTSILAGTPFHKSRTPLRTWFRAIHIMSVTRCGVSAMALMRECGVTRKTAWRMFMQLRRMLLEDVHDLGGDKIVEADETFFGPKISRMNRAARRRLPSAFTVGPQTAKVIVAGLAERGGRIVAYPVERRGFFELTQPIKARVKPGTEIHTDEAPQYVPLKHWGYVHKLVKHKDGVYVDESGVTTNTIEGWWSHVKGSIRGTHKHISRRYMQQYLDQFAFTYNHRDDGRPMFRAFFAQISTDFVQRHHPAQYRPRKIA